MLKELNRDLFLWINTDGGHHYVWLDALMRFASDPRSAIAILIPLALYVFYREGRGGFVFLGGLVLMLMISDYTGAVIKHAVGAVRPCATLEGVRLLAEYCGRNSFPSNHSLNMAATAVYVSIHYRRLMWPFVLLALLVGLSRIYVGVHYPGDVLAGWTLGAILGLAFSAGLGYARRWHRAYRDGSGRA